VAGNGAGRKMRYLNPIQINIFFKVRFSSLLGHSAVELNFEIIMQLFSISGTLYFVAIGLVRISIAAFFPRLNSESMLSRTVDIYTFTRMVAYQ